MKSYYGHTQIPCLGKSGLINHYYQVIKALPQYVTLSPRWGAGHCPLCTSWVKESKISSLSSNATPVRRGWEARQNPGCLKPMWSDIRFNLKLKRPQWKWETGIRDGGTGSPSREKRLPGSKGEAEGSLSHGEFHWILQFSCHLWWVLWGHFLLGHH